MEKQEETKTTEEYSLGFLCLLCLLYCLRSACNSEQAAAITHDLIGAAIEEHKDTGSELLELFAG